MTKKLVQWKRMWQLCSGTYYETPCKTVENELLSVSDHLIDGLHQYLQPSYNSIKNLETVVKDEKNEKCLGFAITLHQFLGIDGLQAYEILKYFLMNEYRGSLNSLNTLFSDSNRLQSDDIHNKLYDQTLEDIWSYYSLERLIILKIIKNIIQYHDRKGHPFWKEYHMILDKIGIGKLRKSLLNQFESLVKEQPPAKFKELANREKKLIMWGERRAREIIEILHILILILNNDGIESSQIQQLIELFQYHAFGKEHEYLDPNNNLHIELKHKICYSEIGLFLVAFNNDGVTEEWFKDVSHLIHDNIVTFHQNIEHGPILLTWMLKKLKFKSNDEDSNLLRQFGVRAKQLKVCNFLLDLISHPIYNDFKNRTAIIIRQQIYNQLNNLCEWLYDEGLIEFDGIFQLLGELLKTPQLANVFIKNDDSPIHAIYLLAKEMFPYQFAPLSYIALGLLQSGSEQRQFIRNDLEQLNVFTTILDGRYNFQLIPSQIGDKYHLNNDIYPLKNVSYVIPAQTSCSISTMKNLKFAHFHINVNYFNIISHQINEIIECAIQNMEITESQFENLELGLTVIELILKKISDTNEIPVEMIAPIENVLEILNKFQILQVPPIKVLAKCLDICAQLLPMVENVQTKRNEILERIFKINLIPTIKHENLDYKQLAMGTNFDSGLVGYYLINYERNQGCYNFLNAYFNLLEVAINKMSSAYDDRIKMYIELPGLVFLLREIFPNIRSWLFENEKERELMYIKTMEYFYHILQHNTDRHTPKLCYLMNQVCIYSLLHFDYGMILLKFIGIGNCYLTSIIENEINWMTISSAGIINIVQLSMKILMLLLKSKNRIVDSTNQTTLLPLETVIYIPSHQYHNFQIIPIVTSYMNNIFIRALPNLSCRLLRRFAIEFNSTKIGGTKSLLTCLDMDPDQIRLTFLQRLNDSLENDSLKISILEFVESCIENDQAGVTAAIFKISNEQNAAIDGILTYMNVYLDTIKNNPKSLESPILSGIMSIFHALWKINHTSLVQNLIKKTDFWPSLCKPLFSDINKNLRVYSQLFNILGIEVFKVSDDRKINEELKKIIENFFEPHVFQKWLDVIFAFPYELNKEEMNEDEIPIWLSRLQSFKDFMVIILRKTNHPIRIQQQNLKYLIDKSLAALNNYDAENETNDYRPFITVSELLLLVFVEVKYFDENDKIECEQIVSQIQNLLNFIVILYETIHMRARNSILTICIKIFDVLPIDTNSIITEKLSILNSTIQIINYEMEKVESLENRQISFRLSLNLLKKIVFYFEGKHFFGWEEHVRNEKLINRIILMLSKISHNFELRSITIELLDILILLSKTQCSDEFIYSDIDIYLWLKLLPPKDLIEKSQTTKWCAQDWWPIYWRSIELVSALLFIHKNLFIKEALLFIGIHDEFLTDSLLLSKQTLESGAITLIKQTLDLIAETIKFEKIWRIDHNQSFFKLMRCVQVVLDNIISLFDRPNNLKRLVQGRTTKSEFELMEITGELPSNDIILAMNELIECVILGTRCLLKLSPELLNLIVDAQFAPSQWHPLVELHVGAPKLNAHPYPTLTFSTLLSASCIFVKALVLQNFQISEEYLNTLAIEYDQQSLNQAPVDLSNSSTDQGVNSLNKVKVGSPHSFSKSRSMVASSHQSHNDFYINLNPELCSRALEYIVTLLASQSLLLLKDPNMSIREKQLIRRDLFPELSQFTDFVRKNILLENKDYLQRKKYGQIRMRMHPDDLNESEDEIGSLMSSNEKQSANHKRTVSNNSMRINVMRKQHLSQQKSTPNISKGLTRSSIKAYKHRSDSDTLTQTETPKRFIYADHYKSDQEEDIEFIDDSDDQKFANQTLVQLVERDYFHILGVILSTLHVDV